MKRSKKAKAQKTKLLAGDLAEDALQVVAKVAPLDEDIIKTLRLVCKRTSAAATGRVREFKLNHLREDAAFLRASGLLTNIWHLEIDLDLRASGDEAQFVSQWSCAVDIFQLLVDTCRKSVRQFDVKLHASPEIIMASACLLGKSSWDSMEQLFMAEGGPMPGFLSGFLARPGSFPALDNVHCECPTASDIDALSNSGIAENLVRLCAYWSFDAHESNTAPAMMASMQNLLQKATNLEECHLGSNTFDFLEHEKFSALKELSLDVPLRNGHISASPKLSRALARPWQTLEILTIGCALVTPAYSLRIFEDQDSFACLDYLRIERCQLQVDELSCIRLPRLRILELKQCTNGHTFISKMAELMKSGTCFLPGLRKIDVDAFKDIPALVVKALSDLLSCPAMAALERVSIVNAQLTEKNDDLLCCIANHCPKLYALNLSENKFGRSAIALLQGYGNMGVWPKLQKLGILEQDLDDEDPNKMDGGHPYLPKLDVQETLRRAWPGLDVY